MYDVIESQGQKPIKHWTKHVRFDDNARQQLIGLSTLPFIGSHIAVMPDVHLGNGSCIGSVVPTVNAIIPACVGVDLGCGMMAVKTNLHANNLPDNLSAIQHEIERMVPHGRTNSGQAGKDKGAWKTPPKDVVARWNLDLKDSFKNLTDKHSELKNCNNINHLSTLGSGNHFLELCLDENNAVWIMLHSGSRGVGNRIGSHFIGLAKKDMERLDIHLPSKDLAYLQDGAQHFDDYVEAVSWAQKFALINREIMMARAIQAIKNVLLIDFDAHLEAINCHHNYISLETHFGSPMWITRKGAVRAGHGEMGIIPGSMGAKSFIVRGLGNAESFCSCSHGAGRVMSRTEAVKTVSLEEHAAALKGIACNKTAATLDETPRAYKNLDDVMRSQSDLVEIVHTLRQVVCVKGENDKHE